MSRERCEGALLVVDRRLVGGMGVDDRDPLDEEGGQKQR